MKKTIAMLTVAVLLISLLLTGCGQKSGSLKLENGVLSWEAVDGALSYEVSMGGHTETVSDPSYDLASASDYVGEYTVSVSAVKSNGKRTELGSLDVTATTMSKPVVGVTTAGGDPYFTWNAVDGASGYWYDAHDGGGLRQATAEEDGSYRVKVTNTQQQMIRGVAKGSSKENVLMLSAETLYQYESDQQFDMALLAKHPAAITSTGKGVEQISVGTTLSTGLYELEVSVYVMDSSGHQLAGNGTWGRRFISANDNIWFCANELEQWPGSGGTIPAPDVADTRKMTMAVDRGGNVVFTMYDWIAGEMMVVADIKHNGVSVLNESGGLPNPLPEVQKFDVSTLGNYLKVYQASGTYLNDDPDASKVLVPTTLPDGEHAVNVSYYVMTAAGDLIEGNGLWGRRITGSDPEAGDYAWLNEYDISSNFPAVTMPRPTQLKTSLFNVVVKDGHLTLHAIDFNIGEMLVIQEVKEMEIPSGNGVFVSSGELSEKFRILTTLTGDTRLTGVKLEITYEVSDVLGGSLSGNGTWGRRMYAGDGEHWLCTTDPSEGKFPVAAGTLPEAGKAVTETFTIAEIGKKGGFSIEMLDFNAGEMVKITSIKYNGQEVLLKED